MLNSVKQSRAFGSLSTPECLKALATAVIRLNGSPLRNRSLQSGVGNVTQTSKLQEVSDNVLAVDGSAVLKFSENLSDSEPRVVLHSTFNNLKIRQLLKFPSSERGGVADYSMFYANVMSILHNMMERAFTHAWLQDVIQLELRRDRLHNSVSHILSADNKIDLSGFQALLD